MVLFKLKKTATFRVDVMLVFVLLLVIDCSTRVAAFQTDSTPGSNVRVGEVGEGEIGIAMAGGSLRAFATCYGVLRGFQQKKVRGPNGEEVPAMNLIKYNSGISGGSFPAVLYSYARVSTEQLLETGRTIDPSQITFESLSEMPNTSMGYVIAKKPKTTKLVIQSVLQVLMKPWNILKIHALWNFFVYKKFFDPMKIPNNKFFTSSKEELSKIIQDNPKLKERDFLIPRADTKTLPMILVTMHGSRADKNKYEQNFMQIYKTAWDNYKEKETCAFYTNTERPSMSHTIELACADAEKKDTSNLPMPYVITPDFVENKYSGMAQVRNEKVRFPEKIVKPFGWGAKRGKYGRKARFSLELLAGMSTNFIGSAKSLFSLFITGLRKIDLTDTYSVTQRFADGGTNDLMGILPLVARGTKNIVAVYNFNQSPPQANFSTTYADVYRHANATSLDDPDFEVHFSEWIKRVNPRITCYFGFFSKPIHHVNIMNHVFKDPNIDRLKELMIKYNSLFQAGEPLVATLKDLEVIDNKFWSIQGGKKIDLTLMWFHMPKNFSEKVKDSLKLEIDEHGRFVNETYAPIPELPVAGLFDAFKYTNEQINMMGYLGSWIVHRSWNGLKGHDGEYKFEGFGKIFEREQ